MIIAWTFEHWKSKTMGPLPRVLQPNDISLFESLGIVFYEALFSMGFTVIFTYIPNIVKQRYIKRVIYPNWELMLNQKNIFMNEYFELLGGGVTPHSPPYSRPDTLHQGSPMNRPLGGV